MSAHQPRRVPDSTEARRVTQRRLAMDKGDTTHGTARDMGADVCATPRTERINPDIARRIVSASASARRKYAVDLGRITAADLEVTNKRKHVRTSTLFVFRTNFRQATATVKPAGKAAAFVSARLYGSVGAVG